MVRRSRNGGRRDMPRLWLKIQDLPCSASPVPACRNSAAPRPVSTEVRSSAFGKMHIVVRRSKLSCRTAVEVWCCLCPSVGWTSGQQMDERTGEPPGTPYSRASTESKNHLILRERRRISLWSGFLHATHQC